MRSGDNWAARWLLGLMDQNEKGRGKGLARQNGGHWAARWELGLMDNHKDEGGGLS